jgi:haloalkane dehalogenase
MRLLDATEADADLAEELSLLRLDPILVEQELDARPEFAAALERVVGLRAGRRWFRSDHDHLYGLELGDLGRSLPSTATLYGCWERWEPRPPEHEIDADLAAFSSWLAATTAPHGGALDPGDVAKVFERAGLPAAWPEGSVARTPDAAFDHLPDFPYEPRYLEIEGLRVARVEAGDAGAAETFLLLHGEPTWSYLYRQMIPTLAKAGRVVAPDLVGFGRSDKPVGASAYTYRSHTRWLRKHIEALDLRGVTLVCQDWGGLLGLRVVAEHPERFRRIVVMNTSLPDGRGASDAFLAWRRYSQRVASMDVAAMMQRAVRRPGFTSAEAAAYAAPFPTPAHQAGALVFPRLVPIRSDQLAAWENRRARARLAELDLPALVLFSDSDPITRPAREDFGRLLRRVELAPLVAGAGHFLQEDAGEEIAATIAQWVARTAV